MTHTPTPWNFRGSHVLTKIEERDFTIAGTDFMFSQSSDEAAINAARIVACVNFFHGHDIKTENIPEGGFWDMVNLLKRVPAATNAANYAGEFEGAASANLHDGYAPNRQAEKAYKPAKDLEDAAHALLTKLGIE